MIFNDSIYINLPYMQAMGIASSLSDNLSFKSKVDNQ